MKFVNFEKTLLLWKHHPFKQVKETLSHSHYNFLRKISLYNLCHCGWTVVWAFYVYVNLVSLTSPFLTLSRYNFFNWSVVFQLEAVYSKFSEWTAALLWAFILSKPKDKHIGCHIFMLSASFWLGIDWLVIIIKELI